MEIHLNNVCMYVYLCMTIIYNIYYIQIHYIQIYKYIIARELFQANPAAAEDFEGIHNQDLPNLKKNIYIPRIYVRSI